MGWINLASLRYETEQSALESIETWEKKPDLRSIGFGPALYAAMAGRKDIFDRAVPLSVSLLEKLSSNEDEHLAMVPVLSDVIGLACVAQIAGHDQTELFERIAKLKKLNKDITKALHQVVVRLVSDKGGSDDAEPAKPGHVRTEAAWYKALDTLPARHLLSMALAPDHPLWLRALRHFVLPLALLVAKQNPDASPLELLRLGAYSERHTEVLYERRSPKPEWGTAPEKGDPATWTGFDAIEVYDKELLVYHYLGFTWQAPLVFEGDQLNAFQFLEQLDLSWKLVEDALSDSDWKKLEKLRETLPCVHVVVHDRTLSKYLPAHMKRAAEHYQVSLRAADVTEL